MCRSASTGTTAAQVDAARKALQPHVPAGHHLCVVGLPGGYEAAVFDNTGDLSFWSTVDPTHWKKDRTARYPYDARDAVGQQVSVDGALLAGQVSATFVVHGHFTGDGTGNAVAYTVGRRGWGPVVADGAPDKRVWGTLTVAQHLPARSSDAQVSHYAMSFEQGDLVTYDCDSSHEGGAQCAAHLQPTHWKWNTTGHYFEADES